MPAALNEQPVDMSDDEDGPTIVDKMRSAVYKMFFHPDNPISTPRGFKKLLESLPDGKREEKGRRRKKEICLPPLPSPSPLALRNTCQMRAPFAVN